MSKFALIWRHREGSDSWEMSDNIEPLIEKYERLINLEDVYTASILTNIVQSTDYDTTDKPENEVKAKAKATYFSSSFIETITFAESLGYLQEHTEACFKAHYNIKGEMDPDHHLQGKLSDQIEGDAIAYIEDKGYIFFHKDN